jgi:DNA repair protein RadC
MTESVERLIVLHIDATARVRGVSEFDSGLADKVEVPFRAIVADALRFEAEALVVMHNHPGGDCSPSARDIVTTHALSRVVAPLGLRVHDHIVTAGSERFSFRAAGLL